MMMQRREFLLATGAAALPLAALAHHGWSSFDESVPLYLEGTLKAVKWQNPHVELSLSTPRSAKLPADLATRSMPAQQAAVDAPRILSQARLPDALGADWRIELAPLFRMQAWKVDEPRPGTRAAVIGYTFPRQQGERILRAEFLFIDSKAYSLRSLPA